MNKSALQMPELERAGSIFYYATEGIVIANDKGKIVQINPSAEKLFGYEKGELIGNPVEVLIPRKISKKHEEYRDRYNKKPHPRVMGIGMDLHGMRKDGSEFPVEVSLSPFTNTEGNFVIAFIIDITVRKNVEEELRSQKEELGKLNKELDFKVKERTLILEEAITELNKTKEELNDALTKEKELGDLKSRFVSMASHEFRTPLTAILSSLSLISKYGEMNDKEKQVKHINNIKTAVGNLTDILNDILSISKIEEGKFTVKPEEMNIKENGLGIVNELITVAKVGQKITFNHSGIEEIVFDKRVFRHLIFNLVSNAIKFSDEGKQIDVVINVDKESINIDVRDNGIGISPEDQKHLFERFFRAANASSVQGTGLGLNIVYKYVEILNGSIECNSKLGQGTTFAIKLKNI
jgi:PAS domain S-box-containing protein